MYTSDLMMKLYQNDFEMKNVLVLYGSLLEAEASKVSVQLLDMY